MYIGYGMGKEDWKKLIDALKNTEGIMINRFPETDNEGYFVDYKYVLLEHDDIFFYMDDSFLEGFGVTTYQKVSPYEKRQIKYPYYTKSFDDIVEYIKIQRKIRPLENAFKQKIYHELYGVSNGTTALWKLRNQLAGFREKDILNNLAHIEMVLNSDGYKVLRFWHTNEVNYFDYECNSKRIVG